MAFCEILIIAYLVYAPLILLFYWRLLKSFSHPKYTANKGDKFKPFMRTDYANWNHLEIYFGALFILPIRAIGTIVSAVIFYILLQAASKFHSGGPDLPWKPSFYRVNFALKFIARCYMFFSGFQWISRKYVKYSTYDPSYVQAESDLSARPSIIISNHISWFDTFTYVYLLLPAFLSKDTVGKYPFFGSITTNLKTIYVSRESEESRKQAEKAIAERIQRIDSGELYPPLIIFPEGTVSNGHYLLSFKRGAFEQLKAIKIYALKYSDRHFNISLASTGMLGTAVTFLSMVQLTNSLEVIEFEGLYNPSHLDLSRYPEEKRWEVYAERVKDIMAKCLNIEKSDSGYRESREYDNMLAKHDKKLD